MRKKLENEEKRWYNIQRYTKLVKKYGSASLKVFLYHKAQHEANASVCARFIRIRDPNKTNNSATHTFREPNLKRAQKQTNLSGLSIQHKGAHHVSY